MNKLELIGLDKLKEDVLSAFGRCNKSGELTDSERVHIREDLSDAIIIINALKENLIK